MAARGPAANVAASGGAVVSGQGPGDSEHWTLTKLVLKRKLFRYK
jgi:hypothetical protein